MPSRPLDHARKRPRLVWLLAALAFVGAGLWLLLRFPKDTTPEGAYMRVARAIGSGKPEQTFAYLEEEAQHACFTIGDYACKAVERIEGAYPEPQRTAELERYRALEPCKDGAEVWARIAADRGYINRLRRDLSGVVEVAITEDRASVVTARGTRYAFRRRPNGIWGLTLFTVELETEAEKLARDWDRIQAAAADYQRAGREGIGGGR